MKYWLILLFALSGLHAQSPLQSEKHWFYTHYYEAEQPLRPAQLWQRLETQISSHALAQNARRKLRTARWLQGAGALVLGMQTAHWVSSGAPPKWQWSLPALGAVGYSIPLERKGNRKLKQAVKAYNDSLKKQLAQPQ